MKTVRKPFILAPKDLYRLSFFEIGSKSALYRTVEKVRNFVEKDPRQPLTVIDVAEFLGVEVEQVERDYQRSYVNEVDN